MTRPVDPVNGFSPLMRQYHAIKQQHPDKILFFRMGDFYEMFGDDAVLAAPLLGIALTSRSHGKGERTPLAGVPYHSVDRYLARLLAKGHKVVVVEQVEDPKTARGLVKREVVEVLTPGTATIDAGDSSQLEPSLAAVFTDSERTLGFALLDMNTGSFMVDEGPVERLMEKLRVMEPTEVLYPGDMRESVLAPLQRWFNGDRRLFPYEEWNFDYRTADRELNAHFGTSTLEGFGVGDARLAVTAAGAVFRYLRENHRERLTHISRLTRIADADHMLLDYATVRNLELVRSVSNASEENTLFAVVNRCQTAAGTRRLRHALIRPFKDKARIDLRLGAVDELVRNRELCARISDTLKGAPDLEKLAGRVGIGKLNPRQAASLSQALQTARDLARMLEAAKSEHLVSVQNSIPDNSAVIDMLGRALVDEPPMVTNKGGIFKPGYAARLNELNDSIRAARDYIGSLQQSERARTGIGSLKVGYNKVFGYYLEVTNPNRDQVPPHYIRKQTLVNAERYITPELKEKEELILAAEEKIFRLEAELYSELLENLNQHIGNLQLTAELSAEIDLVAALAELAVERGYCRPEIFDDTRLNIINGRHPVVESVLPSGSFVANDLALSTEDRQIIVLTGPNMSGKSTYLRQVGLIVILAQIGSWVPADSAEIGLADRVFTRVGALDNLAGGQSTFLVEMVETANILNNAGERSLVLLDEVGRGTSTFDGLSVAWSVVERLNDDCRCRTVFATHYHELTGMAALYERIHNFQVAVKRREDSVVFLHKIVPGGCDDSYGIEVARLAGLPRTTISRAKQILRLLESGKFTQSELGKGLYKEKVQTTLFEAPSSEIEEKIRQSDLEHMSPVEAFDFLRKLKDELL
ncbi:MAG: DNA mismatch repair protein MutS [Candidatus Zixiibacteriota bacterium]